LWCARWPRKFYMDVENVGGRCDDFTKEADCDLSRCQWKNGKCKFVKSWCQVMPGRDRMLSFENYANGGLTGKTCCCDGTLYDDYEYEKTFDEEGTVCEDYKQADGNPWHDKNGYTCRVYHYGELCEDDGSKGENWQSGWGTLNDHGQVFSEFGKRPVHAKTACCTCGGGWRGPHWDQIPTNNLRKIDKFLKKDFKVKFINKAKKHFRILSELQGTFDPDEKSKVDECFRLFANDKINSENLWISVKTCFCELRDIIDPNGNAPGYDFWKRSC